MAAVTTIIAAASLAVAAGGAYMNYKQQRAASRAQQEAADEQRGIQSEQHAANAEQAAAERRQQIREQRIRRAQILQSAENTGTDMSSGELGALSSISTQFNSNVGANLSAISRANRMSGMSQRAADASSRAAQHSMNAGVAQGLSNIGGSLFQTAGGWGALRNIGGIKPGSGFTMGGSLFRGTMNPSTPIYRLN